jgi:hypothetical protein
MSPEALELCGIALYGESWQGEFSREFGVGTRSIRRWLNGSTPIPDGLKAEIQDALLIKAKEVGEALMAIK